ncbi:hypothetical protein Z052_02915 [Halorubrum sp. C191]|uniref:hypothetical protein n=1 Tax=Halorubrum sp. C191 TaxID=1383842 RepID=UPI000C0797D3|nr:hypothetical protein [Halorubrum sp. C191]PHQ43602.1 hypothetical protein Z052_02915 [Halorubrum sp. C191]
MNETDDEEFQTLVDSIDENTLRGDYFGGGVFLLFDETYTIDCNGNGEYRVYGGEEQVLTNADFSEVKSLLKY